MVTLLFATNAYGYKQTTYKEITVQSGDSLWTLAQKYGTSSDIRKSVYQIKKLNHLDTSEIYAGSVLRVPCDF